LISIKQFVVKGYDLNNGREELEEVNLRGASGRGGGWNYNHL
jgi:hypothetical protein